VHDDDLIAEHGALREELASLGLELERLKHNPASTEEHAAYWRWFVAFIERLDQHFKRFDSAFCAETLRAPD
jgi:hypothetical protein